MPNGDPRDMSAKLDAIIKMYNDSSGFETAHNLRRLSDEQFQEALDLLQTKDFDFKGQPRHLGVGGEDNDPDGGRVLHIKVLPGPTP
ncbi:MAG: hypothetical protein ACI89L_002157 [Phycisphaerales bacterium]|jgi:hypothetical protein